MTKTTKRKKGNKSILEANVSIGGVTLAEKALFAKHLAVMLHSGMTIVEALGVAEDSAQGKFKKIIASIGLSIKSGRSLSDSLANYPKVFSELFINVAKAGEASGTLVENLENISDGLKKEKELIGKVKGALLYPVIVLVATFILGMTLVFFVLPKITPLFEGLNVDLPFTTRALIDFSHFIQESGFYFFWGIVVFFVALFWFVKQNFSKPITHKIILKTPVLNKLVRNTNLARFSRTLGMLLQSGVNIDEALEIVKSTMGNFYYRKALNDVSKRVGKGVRLADGLEGSSELFPKLLTKMIHVGEESGRFEDTLFYLADYYEEEVDTSTKSLSTALEPILLIFIGLVVGFLALSIITPIYDITGNIKR